MNNPNLNFKGFEVPRQALEPFKLPKIVTASEVMNKALSGEAAFVALRQAVNELQGAAPKDHDVLIQAFNLSVLEVRFLKPHVLLFRGEDGDGHKAFAVCHFSQLVAHIIYRPKRGEERVITGFSKG